MASHGHCQKETDGLNRAETKVDSSDPTPPSPDPTPPSRVVHWPDLQLQMVSDMNSLGLLARDVQGDSYFTALYSSPDAFRKAHTSLEAGDKIRVRGWEGRTEKGRLAIYPLFIALLELSPS